MKFNTNEEGGWIIPEGSNITVDIPDYSVIGNYCKIGDYCTIGNGCIIGDGFTIGYDCEIGDYCTIGDYCKFGDCCKFGYGCEIASIKIVKLMTLSNVDGSGRQVKLIFDGENVHIEAGCFFGDVNGFCEKAEKEGKHFYSKIIRNNAFMMLEHYKIS
jgi:NDP-sugar pyrophosphorylase family protein